MSRVSPFVILKIAGTTLCAESEKRKLGVGKGDSATILYLPEDPSYIVYVSVTSMEALAIKASSFSLQEGTDYSLVTDKLNCIESYLGQGAYSTLVIIPGKNNNLSCFVVMLSSTGTRKKSISVADGLLLARVYSIPILLEKKLFEMNHVYSGDYMRILREMNGSFSSDSNDKNSNKKDEGVLFEEVIDIFKEDIKGKKRHKGKKKDKKRIPSNLDAFSLRELRRMLKEYEGEEMYECCALIKKEIDKRLN